MQMVMNNTPANWEITDCISNIIHVRIYYESEGVNARVTRLSDWRASIPYDCNLTRNISDGAKLRNSSMGLIIMALRCELADTTRSMSTAYTFRNVVHDA